MDFLDLVKKGLNTNVGDLTDIIRDKFDDEAGKRSNKREAKSLSADTDESYGEQKPNTDTKSKPKPKPKTNSDTSPTFDELYEQAEQAVGRKKEILSELFKMYNEACLPRYAALDDFLKLFNSDGGIIKYIEMFNGRIEEYGGDCEQTSPEILHTDIFIGYVKPLTELVKKASAISGGSEPLGFESVKELESYLRDAGEEIPKPLSTEKIAENKKSLNKSYERRLDLKKQLDERDALIEDFRSRQTYALLLKQPKTETCHRFEKMLRALTGEDIRELTEYLSAAPTEESKDDYIGRAQELSSHLKAEALPYAKPKPKVKVQEDSADLQKN